MSLSYRTRLIPCDDASKIKNLYTMYPGMEKVMYMGGVIGKKSIMNDECLRIPQPAIL